MVFQKSLSDVVELLKDKDHEDISDAINKYAGFFVTAGTIAAILIAPVPMVMLTSLATGATLTAFKPGNFFRLLHDKFNYSNKGRELTARQRDEKLSLVNILVIHLSARDAFKEEFIPYLEELLEGYEPEDEHKDKLKEIQLNSIEATSLSQLGIPSARDLSEIHMFIAKIFMPIQDTISTFLGDCDKEQLSAQIQKCIDKTSVIYNAYTFNLISEFPEFALWTNLKRKDQLLKYIDSFVDDVANEVETRIQPLFKEIEKLQSDSYSRDVGLRNIVPTTESVICRHEVSLINSSNLERIKHIVMHHRDLRDYLNKPILENEEMGDIKLSTNENMYIAQSYKLVNYSMDRIGFDFLSPEFWETPDVGVFQGEDIGGQLIKSLLDPNNSTSPILLLGNPGAGKSMFSQIFAARLCDSNDFVPFLVKLRDVASSNSHLIDHINQGLSLTLPGKPDVDWFAWVQECRNRIPVIILDGFDELLQASSTTLNGYLSSIRELQQQAYVHEISLRVIITSRLSIMKDIAIPKNTTIFKLDSFDDKRRDLWVERWNALQDKEEFQPFKVPNNEHIKDLAKEPLLLLLLAVYDFENSELQLESIKHDFDQSRLYDKLFHKFTLRQLNKSGRFKDLSEIEKNREIMLYRLRLGLISIMMFLRDSTSHNEMNLTKEIEQFELNGANLDGKKIFSGFFFIHENQAIKANGNQLYNFEFLHKTFGEFLAADFLLRVANSRVDRTFRKLNRDGTFRFCFGYNWLYKHPKIVSFLFEHSQNVIDECKEKVVLSIYSELEDTISTKSQVLFPVNEINVDLDPLPVLEHLSIYSQNLVLLLVAISGCEKIKFEISESVGGYNSRKRFGSQIAEGKITQGEFPTNENAYFWRTLVELWNATGNNIAAAKLSEWINVEFNGNEMHLVRVKGGVTHFFGDYSRISGNNFNLLLSLHFTDDLKLEEIEQIVRKDPQLIQLALEVINHRFDQLKQQYGLIEIIDRVFNLFSYSDELLQSKAFAKMLCSIHWHVSIEKVLQHFSSARLLANNLNAPLLRILLENYQGLRNEFYEELFYSYFDLKHNQYSEILSVTEVIAEHFGNRNFGMKYVQHVLYNGDFLDNCDLSDVFKYLNIASRGKKSLEDTSNIEIVLERVFYNHKLSPRNLLKLLEYAIIFKLSRVISRIASILIDEYLNSSKLGTYNEIRLIELITYLDFNSFEIDYLRKKLLILLDRKQSSKVDLVTLKLLETLIYNQPDEYLIESSVERLIFSTLPLKKPASKAVTMALLDFVFIHCRGLSIHERLVKYLVDFMRLDSHGLSERIRFIELLDSYGPRLFNPTDYLREIMDQVHNTREGRALISIEENGTLRRLWHHFNRGLK